MNRQRRLQIIRRTTKYVADVVENLPAVDGGVYETLAEFGTPAYEEETSVAVETVKAIARRLRAQAEP